VRGCRAAGFALAVAAMPPSTATANNFTAGLVAMMSPSRARTTMAGDC
jgi:hypothetical protein